MGVIFHVTIDGGTYNLATRDFAHALIERWPGTDVWEASAPNALSWSDASGEWGEESSLTTEGGSVDLVKASTRRVAEFAIWLQAWRGRRVSIHLDDELIGELTPELSVDDVAARLEDEHQFRPGATEGHRGGTQISPPKVWIRERPHPYPTYIQALTPGVWGVTVTAADGSDAGSLSRDVAKKVRKALRAAAGVVDVAATGGGAFVVMGPRVADGIIEVVSAVVDALS